MRSLATGHPSQTTTVGQPRHGCAAIGWMMLPWADRAGAGSGDGKRKRPRQVLVASRLACEVMGRRVAVKVVVVGAGRL